MTDSMNKPEIETLSYKPKAENRESVECHNTMTSRECIGCVIDAVGECHLYNPEQSKCKTCGGSGKGRLIGVKGGPNFFESCPDCKKKLEPKPQQPKWHCGGTGIIKATKEEKESYGELDIDCSGCPDCKPEQPNTNAMIFEQANGSIKVTLELLEQLETKNTNEETQKQGCIWTLKGWHNNNLKHLQKAFE